MEISSTDILLYLTGNATPEVTRICDELRKDPRSKVAMAVEQLKQYRTEELNIDLESLVEEERLEPTARPQLRLIFLGCLGLIVVSLALGVVALQNHQLRAENEKLARAGNVVDRAAGLPIIDESTTDQERRV